MNSMSSSFAENAATESAHEAHDPFLAHHFESHRQQFDAGKLGMWLFLVTEILFFSGLFVAYAVYRSSHPEVFVYAHQFLDKSLGAVNTIILLFSSLTMAWGVRCAQLNQRRGLVWCLAITLACASMFLGIKAVEYSHKWDEGLLWARYFAPATHGHDNTWTLVWFSLPAAIALIICGLTALVCKLRGATRAFIVAGVATCAALVYFVGVAAGIGIPTVEGQFTQATPATETDSLAATSHGASGAKEHESSAHSEETAAPSHAGIFFSIYFTMTGVHAIHVVAGMGVILWILSRSVRGDFGSGYFGPVDYVGLYWHLVDMVWIFLFPLLYLIH